MSDDDNRRGRGGPRKPGGGDRSPGGRSGSREGGRGQRRPAGKGFGAKRPFGARDDRPRDDRSRDDRPRSDRPRDDRPRGDRPFTPRRPREDEGGEPRPFRKPRFDRGHGDDRPNRSRDEGRSPRRFDGADRGDRPERKRPAPRPLLPRTGNPERLLQVEKEGGVERIARVIARAGAASRREAEELIVQGRVAVNGETITSPALDVPPDARITIDGERLPARERTRLFLYHKPAGLVTTTRDPEGRPTVFDALPEDLPRVVTIGRLDINTEGLLLLTNDGGLARVLGHPQTAWLRRYRVRAYGHVEQARLDELARGITIDGEAFGPIVATVDREQGDNTWLTIDLREGRNREVKRVLEHLGLTVNRLIRVSFGPFQLGDLPEGAVEEVRTKVLREQLGEQLSAIAGADFEAPIRAENRIDRPRRGDDGDRAPRGRFAGRVRGDRGGDGDRGSLRDRAQRRERDDAAPHRGRATAGRPSPYRRATEDAADDAPREILRRAEDGRPAVWRDAETSGMKPRRTGPRRGADPREARERRAHSLAAEGRERERAEPVADRKGRRVTVERITGPGPDLPRKPRYTRDDFKPRDGRERLRHAQGDRPSGERSVGARPERSGGDRPFRRRGDGDGRPEARSFDDRTPDRGKKLSGNTRPQDESSRSRGSSRPDGSSRPGGRASGGRPPRGDGPPRSRPSGPRRPRG